MEFTEDKSDKINTCWEFIKLQHKLNQKVETSLKKIMDVMENNPPTSMRKRRFGLF